MVDMDLIILGVLQGYPMHGYYLKQQIEASFGKRFFNLSNSALYPKLAKLEANGYIQSRREQQDKVPDRKVYEITPAGRQRIHDLVTAPRGPREDYVDFKGRAVFFDLLTSEERQSVTEPFLKAAEQELKEALEKREKFSKYMGKYSLLVLDSGIEELQNQVHFFNELMDKD
jgi:DNA-binding PadR family transcriptional regulator